MKPEKIKLTVNSQAKFENLPAHIAKQVQYALTCPNPKYQQLSRLNKYTGSTRRLYPDLYPDLYL